MTTNPQAHRHDLEEALLAMASSSPTFREAGIDEHFAATYAKHAWRFDQLPEATRHRLAAQFSHMAGELSYADSVGRKHPESLQRDLADWFKSVLVLMVHQTQGLGAAGPVKSS